MIPAPFKNASLNRSNLDLLNNIAPVTSYITVTVGDGKDFSTFHEAMTWATRQPTNGQGFIQLVLDDGVHEIPVDALTWDSWSYYTVTNNISIQSASENKALCTITLSGDDDGDNWPGVISIDASGYLYMQHVTVDIGLNGYPYPENVGFAWGYGAARFNMYQGIIKSGLPIWAAHHAMMSLSNTQLLGQGSPGEGIKLYAFATCEAYNTTIDGFTVGISVNDASVFMKNNGGSFTLSNNTADTNIPFNEIQYQGGYISNAAAALSFKA